MSENQISMDEAAVRAKVELDAGYEKWSAVDLVKWWTTYFGTAGHKRLGRLLVEKGKK